MARTYATEMDLVRGTREAPRIRWSAIFGGLILGLGVWLLLSSLWTALAYASDVGTIRDDLPWYIGGSAVFSLLFAGVVTGYLAGGAGRGMLHGTALWALLLVVTVTIGLPSVLNVFDLGRVIDQATAPVPSTGVSTLWVAFWTILGGFIGAGLGGAIGGAFAGPAVTTDANRTVVVPDGEPHPGETTSDRAPTHRSAERDRSRREMTDAT